MPFDPRLIQESFALVQERGDKVAGHFYALMFLEDPSLRDMFPPMMDSQRDRLMGAIVRVVNQVHDPESLVEYLRQLGRDHRKFGVQAEHYETVGRCLVAAMKRFAKPGWTAEMDAAWSEAFGFLADTMITAADEASRTTPPFWTGRVVAHRRPIDSLALITIEPDNPYPFRPGQYAAIETLRWPRVWRPYSIANAPRPDGLLTFQIRAVDGGWVSSALVNHTRLGDTVRLGPAIGGMVCDAISPRDVLLVGGGTGIAPMLAIAEDMTRWNTNRQVTVYFGTRKAAELYALPQLEALRERAPWLTIVSCVSHDNHYRGERGMLPDVLTRHGADSFNWGEHDICISGSAAMVRATLARLTELEVPGNRIRFDAFGEQTDVYLGHKQRQEKAAATAARKVLSSGEKLPQRQPQRPNQGAGQASKSNPTSAEVGNDWQVSKKPPLFSSGSRA
jgi:NAD(P)H-flavin reductase/hemoglobin-like flavoprotein